MLDLVKNLLRLAFPEVCLACTEYEPLKGEQLCLACIKTLPFVSSVDDAQSALEGKESFPGSLLGFMSLFYYSKESQVAEMIHKIKYEGQYNTARYLGSLLGKKLAKIDNWDNYTIVPVPIHPNRRKKRVFNQAEEIAKGVVSILNIPMSSDFLYREKNARSQTAKGKFQRTTEDMSPFKVSKKAPTLDHILLIDDVVTTGSTIASCTSQIGSHCECSIFVAALGVSI